MNNDLIERYLYAVTKRMDRKQREDVAQELRSLIEDMLLERCGEVSPTEKDLRVVLTELGTPQELSAKYDEDGKKCLIGQPYYSVYNLVMKIVLLSVAGGLTVANLILYAIEPVGFFAFIGRWLAYLWEGLLGSFAIVTLLFAFFSYREVPIKEHFSFDELPPVPRKNEQISIWEPILGIGICVVFAVLFLFTPQVFCIFRDGKMISMFDLEAIRASWWVILLFAICGILREAVQLAERDYNKRVMVTALVTNALSAILCCWWLLGYEVMNGEMLESVRALFAQDANIVFRMLANFDVFFLGIILFALVLDSVDVTMKTLRK